MSGKVCIDCGGPRPPKTTRCNPCRRSAYNGSLGPESRRDESIGPALAHPLAGLALGIPEAIELEADLVAGEVGMDVLAARYDVTTRFIQRARKRLRSLGYPIRTPDGEQCWSPRGHSGGLTQKASVA